MAEHELELRLLATARALDAEAPAFDPALLRAASRPRFRPMLVAVAAVAALVGVTAAPGAFSALRDLFTVESVPELGAVPQGVAPSFLGRPVAADAAHAAVPFRVRTIPSLGAPDTAYVRDDVVGGMVTLAYGSIRLTQWRPADVHAGAAFVPATGTADDVMVGSLPVLWIAGTARGTFTLVGADGAVHRELFDVAEGALLWEQDGVALLLQGAGTRAEALRLALAVRTPRGRRP
jgi:hypothetical protein